MVWRIDGREGNEAGKVRFEIVEYTRGAVLDLGCGPSKAFPHFIGVDNCKDTELFGIQMRPNVTCDLADPAAFAATFNEASCDGVFSSHLLEHIDDYRAALAAWWSVIKPGGHLVLYLPHRDLYPNIGVHGANPDHKHDFDEAAIHDAMVHVALESRTGWDLRRCEKRDEGDEYSFLMVFQKLADGGVMTHSHLAPRPAKKACVVRYGGFGDMIQASNILPSLKAEGYHVTVMTTPKGADILTHDPHVDAFFLQDQDQVPNEWLTDFWTVQAKHFDRFINLSESVEGTWLAYPGRTNHSWPHAVRAQYLNTNYLEFTAQLAGVPLTQEARFYPSREEDDWARGWLQDFREKSLGRPLAPLEHIGPRFNIMLTLAGSSVHKMWPHQDELIAAILHTFPEATFTLCGDDFCRLLEQGWENHPRVRCTSGELSIRQTLALARHMDCVIGPETGVLNAVAFEPMLKVCLLSHSSHDNLTRDWINVCAVEPQDTPCYPCHQLHTDRRFCPEHEPTGASLCAWNTPVSTAAVAIGEAVETWRLLRRSLRRAERAPEGVA